MGAILRKYGVETTIYFPVVKRDVVDLAVAADWTPAAGDTKISKDGGADANTTNAPAAPASTAAKWGLTLTATEMQAAKIAVTIIDSATKVIEDQFLLIETYGHASAEHAFDLDDAEQDVNVVKISGDSDAADNCELMFDGTGYAGGTTKLNVNTSTITNDAITAAAIANGAIDAATFAADVDAEARSWVGLASSNLDTQLTAIKGATFDTSTDSLEAIRNRGDAAWITATGFSTHSAADVVTELGTGSTLTAIPWNAAWDAEVQSECTDALNAYDPPTNTEMEARTLAAAAYATATNQTTIIGYVDCLPASWVTVPTTAEIKTAMEAAGGHLALILDDTGTSGVAIADRTGMKLASDGLDSITATEPSAKPSTFPGWLMWLVQRFRRSEMTASALTVKTEAGATVTTQALSDNGTTQSVGAPS